MSRSAWLAAGVSCLCVYAWHMDWTDKFRLLWQQQRQRVVMVVVGGFCVLLLAGYLLFVLKPDSARGRLFMWKITCRAIAEKPLTGYGIHNFAAAYGNAQETYFAAGDYEPWEERVAGSPEYAFNEYLQVAVELGIPLAVCLLVVVVLCLYRGVRKGRYGICGAILSLMIFSFSSYPLQLPVFIVTFGGLLVACLSGADRWQWLGLAVSVGIIGGFRLKNDLQVEQACREWMNARVLYNAGAYQSAEKEYGRLYPLLRDRASFLFEYGHGLHKQQQFSKSNRILKEALQRSCDPMILNVIGKTISRWVIACQRKTGLSVPPIVCRDVFIPIICLRSFMRNQASGNRTSLKNEVDGIDERAESAFYGNTTDEGGNKKIQLIFVHIKKMNKT